MKILIADDHQQIREILAAYAKREGFQATLCGDGKTALRLFEQERFDLLLLDVMMPVLDGFEVCRAVRAVSDVPIMMITARGEDRERIMGLDIGADDYIVKPFSPSEVMARIRAIMRRMERREAQGESRLIQIDRLRIDLDQWQLWIGEEEVRLSRREMELLYLLAAHPGRVFSRDMLLERLWGWDYEGDARTVDSHVKRLRAKLEPYGADGSIHTVRGVGYRFGKADES